MPLRFLEALLYDRKYLCGMALDPGGAFVYLKGSVGYCVDPSGVLAKELTVPPGFDI